MDVLTVEHLTKKIGNKTILEDVSLNLKRGQIIGLVGANGAGKTSLMKVILGYSSYQDGTFRIIENKNKKSNVGALIENPGIYPFMSGYDSLDPKAVRDVRELILKKAQEGVTFLISSHILSELVKITNSILIINKGKLVTETTEEELNQYEDNDLENVLLNIIDKEDQS